MLIEYTPVSSLTESEKLQLRVMMNNMVIEGRVYIDFFGKYLQVNELLQLKKSWQNETNTRVLLG
jgi:hypothetical protein